MDGRSLFKDCTESLQGCCFPLPPHVAFFPTITQFTLSSTKKYIKNGEREEICSSCGHLYWYLCVDSRVLSIPVLESHGLLITLHSSHTLYLLLPTWTFAIETMIACIMVLTNKGLVRQHQVSHAMRREIVFGILILFINIFSFHRKCYIKTTGHGVGKPEFNFFPTQSFIRAFISPWYEHFKTNGQFPCF